MTLAAQPLRQCDVIAIKLRGDAPPPISRIDPQTLEPPFVVAHVGELGNADDLIIEHGGRELAARISHPIVEDILDVIVFVVAPRVEREGDDAIFVFRSNGAESESS